MNKGFKIKSFTLSELLIVIVISVIIVGLAFTVLNIAQNSFLEIRDNYNKSSRVKSTEQRILIDFNRYPDIRYNSGLKRLIMSSPLDTVKYLIDRNIILRKNDTLLSDIKAVQFYYEGRILESGKIDAIKVQFSQDSADYFFLSKTNSIKTRFY